MRKSKHTRAIPPPRHLSARAKRLWGAIVSRRAKSSERLVLLQAALEVLDRADEARKLLSTEGLTTKTKTTGAVHVHPLLKVEQEARQQFGKIWNDMGLSWCSDLDSTYSRWEPELDEDLGADAEGDSES